MAKLSKSGTTILARVSNGKSHRALRSDGIVLHRQSAGRWAVRCRVKEDRTPRQWAMSYTTDPLNAGWVLVELNAFHADKVVVTAKQAARRKAARTKRAAKSAAESAARRAAWEARVRAAGADPSDFIRVEITRRVLMGAAGTAMFCAACGNLLDARRTVVSSNKVYCAVCASVHGHAADAEGGFPLDGRVAW